MNILLAGDSLIEYFDWQAHLPEHKVANLGNAGESVEGLLSRTMRIKNVCPEADRIFIMTGINNIAMGDDDFFDFYRVIIEKLAGFYHNTKIYIHSLLPAAVDFISKESILRANVALKDLARDQGVEYVDIYSRFVDTQGNVIREYLTDDGVHLSGPGYGVWLNVIKDIIDVPQG